MEATVVRQFLDFFQDFLNLCQWRNWPSDDTTDAEIQNALVIAQHIEKCLDRFQKNNLLNDFLSTLNSMQDMDNDFLKSCLSDPTKIVLKKVINSQTKVTLMDTTFRYFLQMHSDEKLEKYLTDLMLETASKDTLLKNIATELPKEKVMKFKSELLMLQLNKQNKQCIQDMLTECSKDAVEILVVSLCNTDPKYSASVNIISEFFLEVMISKDIKYKKFWKLLFNVDDKHLLKMSVENSDLFIFICEAIIDCGKLLKEDMSAEFFYIEFTHTELTSIVNRLTQNEFLKSLFTDKLRETENDISFWQNMIS